MSHAAVISPVTAPPDPSTLEWVACLSCGHDEPEPFLVAEDDLTGKPGRFRFVTCQRCGFVYQNPRIDVAHIRAYYDDEYIAHRKRTRWGLMTPLYRAAMERLDRRKDAIVCRPGAPGPGSEVLDVGCGAGSFLLWMRSRYGARVTGVDFKDLRHLPGFNVIDFRCGLFYEQEIGADRFDLVTMWHFLEHDYAPLRSLAQARRALRPNGRLVIEVPRLDCWSFRLYRDRWPGLQAPQHTALYTRASLVRICRQAGLEVVDYLPWGAFPAYFYLFAGAAFRILRGRGLNLQKAIYPYFLGQLLVWPVLVFERQLNLAMQTVICRRTS